MCDCCGVSLSLLPQFSVSWMMRDTPWGAFLIHLCVGLCVCVCAPQTLVPALLQCRAFLAKDIPLRFFITHPDAVVLVDRVRLIQMITNGLRYGRLTVISRCSPATQWGVLCVPTRLEHFSLPMRLCSNAGKFTPQGEARVFVALVCKNKDSLSCRSGAKQRPPSRSHSARRSSSVFPITACSGLSLGQTQDAGSPIPAAGDSLTQYLCVTVSNTRAGAPLAKPEDCFLPFKDKGAGV